MPHSAVSKAAVNTYGSVMFALALLFYTSDTAVVALDPVKVCDVLTECGFSRAHWDMLAARLSKDIDVEAVRQEKSTPELCLQETIRQWLNKDTEASWQRLATTVAKISGYGDVVAKEILRKTGTGSVC